MGCETWPDKDAYAECPVCQEPTKRYRGVKPLTDGEAKSVTRRAEFEAYYTTEHTPNLTPLTDEDCAALGINVVHPA